jgi:hypothetical protein
VVWRHENEGLFAVQDPLVRCFFEFRLEHEGLLAVACLASLEETWHCGEVATFEHWQVLQQLTRVAELLDDSQDLLVVVQEGSVAEEACFCLTVSEQRLCQQRREVPETSKLLQLLNVVYIIGISENVRGQEVLVDSFALPH